MEERRTSRRAFLGDLWFLGGGLVASMAWAWANPPGVREKPAAVPEKPRVPMANAATPVPPALPPKKRPGEFQDVQVMGGARYEPRAPGAAR